MLTDPYKNISLTIDAEEQIASMIFDRPNATANLFDQATLEEVISACHELESHRELKGLVISSAKPKIYIAGADLHTLARLQGEELEQILLLGQQMADRLEALPFPKVAAINGACVGGGYELALACDWRVAADSSNVKVGLPETTLGILPCWGGTTRLPKLIGLPNALPLILTGKLLKVRAAKKKGLIDEFCPSENLTAFAKSYLSKGIRSHKSYSHLHNPLSVRVIKSKAKKNVLEKTRGNFPAQLSALDVACAAVTSSRQESLRNEREEFLYLAETPAGKNLINLFFINEKIKKMQVEGVSRDAIPTISTTCVIGAGVMGAGMAYWLTSKGYPTLLKDLNGEALTKGVLSIKHLYGSATKRHVFSSTEARSKLDLLTATTDNVTLGQDLVIEAAVENLEIKKKIFASLATQSRPDTILATNTSALPISQIAEVTPNPERVVGIHFFNPVHRMPLVEVVRTPYTSAETLAATVAFVRCIGKTPIIVQDSPGFLVNRVLVPYLIEAAVMFLNGAEPEHIDEAMLEFGMPMGPLRLLDEVGLDVGMHVAQTLAEAFPDRMHVPDLLARMTETGALGKKSGRGFYLYDKGKSTGLNPELSQYQTGPAYTGNKRDLAHRLNRMIVDETQLCVDEGVVASRDEANLAMILGTGYAPFTGGPLQNE